MLTAILYQMNGLVLNLFSHVEALEGEGQTDAPRAAGAPVAVHSHQGLLNRSDLALFLSLFGFADGPGGQLRLGRGLL